MIFATVDLVGRVWWLIVDVGDEADAIERARRCEAIARFTER